MSNRPHEGTDAADAARDGEETNVEQVLRDALATERAEANRWMISGAALGVLDVVAITALGVGCPLCAVGAPAMIGWGAYRRWKLRSLERAQSAKTFEQVGDADDGPTSPTEALETTTTR